MPRMYRCPGELRHITRGFLYDEREFADVAEGRAQGWAETLAEAGGYAPVSPAPVPEPADDAPPTRAELEQKAKELGIPFNARTSDKVLAERIAAKV